MLIQLTCFFILVSVAAKERLICSKLDTRIDGTLRSFELNSITATITAKNGIGRQRKASVVIPVGSGMRLSFDCSYDPDNHFSFVKERLSLIDCQTLCAIEPECTHFEGDFETCYLKKNFPKNLKPHRKNGTMCGYKKKNLLWRGSNNVIRWADGCTYAGPSYAQENSTLDICVDKCYSERRCTHFTFLNGTCNRMNGTMDPVIVSDKSSICGHRSKWNVHIEIGKPSILWHSGCQYRFKGSSKGFEATLSECQDSCINDAKCGFFNWELKVTTGTCDKIPNIYRAAAIPTCFYGTKVCGSKQTVDTSKFFRCTSTVAPSWTKDAGDLWVSEGCHYFTTGENSNFSFLEKPKCIDQCAQDQNCKFMSWISMERRGYCFAHSYTEEKVMLHRFPEGSICGHKKMNSTGGKVHFID